MINGLKNSTLFVVFFYCFQGQAEHCSIVFSALSTPSDLVKLLATQLSANELKQIKSEVVDLEGPAALRSLQNPDWEEFRVLSMSESIHYSLRPHLQSFRLRPEERSDNAPSIHFIFRESRQLGRLVGPRFVLTVVVLGPYNMNRTDLRTPTLAVESRSLREILFRWSREREPEISTVGYRESGI